jgi:radical SAM superfamily enzyme YgiQ (UPF0313 family)
MLKRKIRVLGMQLGFHRDYPDTSIMATGYNDGIYYVLSYLMEHVPGIEVDMVQMYWGEDPRQRAIEDYDYILISSLATQFWSNLDVLRALRERRAPGCRIIYGGPHATFAPYEVLRYADFVIIGEGEIPIVQLITALETGGNLDQVDNLCRLDERDRLVFNRMQRYGNLNHSLNPALLASAPPLHWATVSMTRGCPFNCSFCYAVRQLGRTYRTKDVDGIVAELDGIKRQTGCGRFYVSDLHFTLRHDFCLAIARRIVDRGYRFVAMSRIEVADDEDFVLEMKRSGFGEYCIGVESEDPATLEIFNKRVDASQQTHRLQRLAELDVGVHSALLFGLDGHDRSFVEKSARWAAEARIIHPTFVCLAEYPFQNLMFGSRQDVEDHRILMQVPTYQLYSFVGMFPRHIRPSALQQAMLDAYDIFFEHAYRIETRPQRRMRLKSYQRSVACAREGTMRHIAFLREVEAPFYRADDTLDEDLLKGDFDKRFGKLRQWLTDSIVKPKSLALTMAH